MEWLNHSGTTFMGAAGNTWNRAAPVLLFIERLALTDNIELGARHLT